MGRHLVDIALARKHEVTLFNRGHHSAEALENVETIHGDRNRDLDQLRGRQWDAVIDTCGYLPRSVKGSAEVLSATVDRYVFISSQSVYADISKPGVNETASLATLTYEQLERANAIDSSGQSSAVTYGEMYGGLKALCEQAAEDVMPGRVLVIRPGLIVGPYDYTDRFTYWPVRVARGGDVLAPGRPKRYVQFIDARDLAKWTVSMIEGGGKGIYNANCSPGTVTMEAVLNSCKAVASNDATFTWASEEFLMKESVAPWSEMPLWIPENDEHWKGFMFINCDKALATGLTARPLEETIKDTLTWYETTRTDEPLKAGMSADKEQTLLSKWHASRSTAS